MINFINGRFLTQKTSGVQRFAREIVTALDLYIGDLGTGEEWILLTPDGAAEDLKLSSIQRRKIGGSPGHLWEQTKLYAHARKGRLVNLCNSGPVLHPRSLTVIHDAMIFRTPENFSRSYRLVHRNLGRILARRGQIATVSKFSRQELAANIGAMDVPVINNSCEHLSEISGDHSILQRLNLEASHYLLFVGSPTPNKNLLKAIEAVGLMGKDAPPFVIVGAAASSVFQASEKGREADQKPMSNRVLFTGRLSDEEVVGLYANAGALLFPSLYEGFGIPPLEAMSLGCPVLASNIAPAIEVCGDAAIYFDPYSTTEMVRAIKELLGSPERRSEMIARGYSRANQYSWSRSAKLLYDAVERL